MLTEREKKKKQEKGNIKTADDNFVCSRNRRITIIDFNGGSEQRIYER